MSEPFQTSTRDAAPAAQPVAKTVVLSSHGQATIAERLERALVLLAYFIEIDGDVHISLFEKLEGELEALRQREATRMRAHERLAAYSQLRHSKGNPLKEL